MRNSKRLSLQITLSFLVFGGVLVVVFGIGLTASLISVENNMLDETLRAELSYFQSQTATSDTTSVFRTRTTHILVTDLDRLENLPAHLRQLAPGVHDATLDGKDYRVLIADVAGNRRFAVQFEVTNIHDRERTFVLLVVMTSMLSLVTALGIGWFLSRRISKPVTQLVEYVSTLRTLPSSTLDLATYHDDEIGLLAREFVHYNEQIQQLIEREKEFAGNVSHELRTPVTNIALAAEVLANAQSLTAKDRRTLGRIQRATREISELIDTFLVLAQIDDSTNYAKSSCDLGPIVENVVAQQQVWIGDKPIRVIVEQLEPLAVNAPANILNVLLANLVRNAFRYTKKGEVTLTIGDNSFVVQDTGVGIPMSTQGKIFQRYVRDNSGDTDGAGLGLAIVHRICERYGWEISFASVERRGSMFRVKFSSE